MKLDSIGRRIWYKTYPYEAAFDIHEMPNTNLYISGYYGIDIHEDALIGILDSAGNEIIANNYGDYLANSSSSSIKLKNGAISAGYNIPPWTNPYGKGWLLRTDEKGDSLWSMNYTLDSLDYPFFNSIALTSDGGFIMSGQNYDEGIRKQSIWVVKVDSLGYLVSGCNPVGLKEVESSPKHQGKRIKNLRLSKDILHPNQLLVFSL